jgi:hypothetical protein
VSSTSFPASVDSASDLKEPECEQSPSAKSSPTAAPCFASIGLTCPSSRMCVTCTPTTQAQLTLFAGATHASHSVLPGSAEARQMTVTSGLSIAGLSKNSGPLGYLERTLLGTSLWGSTRCYLTWKRSVTKAGRLLFRLVPSMLRTGGTASGLLPTPAASDYKSESMSPALVAKRQAASSRGVRLTEYLHRQMLPTPNAGNDHWGGRLDEWGGSTNPFRGTELGKLRVNPSWSEEIMGFPIGWTDCEPLETLSSHTSPKQSAAPSSRRKAGQPSD